MAIRVLKVAALTLPLLIAMATAIKGYALLDARATEAASGVHRVEGRLDKIDDEKVDQKRFGDLCSRIDKIDGKIDQLLMRRR